MMQETDLGLSGIMKVGFVYFMAFFRVWRAVIHLFLVIHDEIFTRIAKA
jgi:hypothetical protein